MVAILALVVAAAVVLLLLRRRRGPSGTADETAATPWESLDRGEDPTEPA